MGSFVSWNSQPLEEWASRYAEGSFIDLAGRSTHFVERGDGDPIILIHGFNMDLHTWDRNIDQLAARFKVYALDLWGLGFSTREPLDYGYGLYAQQIELFMDYLGLDRASLVGHSMGGGTAIVFCSQNRGRVDKLVLVDAVGMPNPLPLTAKIFQLPILAEFLLSLRTDRIRRKNLKDFWIHNHEAFTDDDFQKVTRFQKVRGSTEALLTILRKQFFNTLLGEIRQLAGLSVPTLIVWGREERLLPLHCATEMHRILEGSRLEIIDRAGHLANFDRPDIFNELVVDFLSDVHKDS